MTYTILLFRNAAIVFALMSFIAGSIYWILKTKIKEDFSITYQSKQTCNLIHEQVSKTLNEIKDDVKYLIRQQDK